MHRCCLGRHGEFLKVYICLEVRGSCRTLSSTTAFSNRLAAALFLGSCVGELLLGVAFEIWPEWWQACSRSLKHSATQSIRQRRYDKLTAIFLITDYAYLSVGRCGAIAVLVSLTWAIGGQLIIFLLRPRARLRLDRCAATSVRVIAFTYLLGLLAIVSLTLISRFFAESFSDYRAGVVIPADVVRGLIVVFYLATWRGSMLNGLIRL